MKSFVNSFLLLVILISGQAFAGDNRKVSFLAFNGGSSELDNRSYYEDYIQFFRDSYFKDSTVILNAAGGSSKVIPYDKYGYIDRTVLGNVNYASTNFSESSEASYSGLVNATKQISQSNSKAVTLFFTDHGAPDGVASWKDTISYKDVKSIDKQFADDVIVRRIHFHCYAGGALGSDGENSSPAHKFLRALQKKDSRKNEVDPLIKYPKNRCAFAASREDELAYGFNFAEDEGLKKPLESLKSKHPAPSLTDLKNLFLNIETYSAMPQLTSDYFLQDVSKKLCITNPTYICSKNDGTISQLQNLQTIVSKDFCQKVADTEKQNKEFKRKIDDAYKVTGKLSQIQDAVAFAHVSQKYPSAYRAWTDAQKARETLIYCQTVKDQQCAANEKVLKNSASRSDALDFYEKYLALTSGAQYRRIPLTDKYYNFEWKDDEYEKKLEAAYKGFLQKNWILRAPASFNEAYIKSAKEVSDLQKQRKDFLIKRQTEIQMSMQSYLNTPENKALNERYSNIKACENSPINSSL